MTETTLKKLDFAPISIAHRNDYLDLLAAENEVGCEYTFANLYLWGRQSIAFLHGVAILFSQFNRKSVYPFPVGKGDIKSAIDAIIADSRARGITCRLTGITPERKVILDELYPKKFSFHCDEGSHDYVYAVDDLADLKGKKYHSKRNHYNRFSEEYEGYSVEPICDGNIDAVRAAADKWYADRLAEDPQADLEMERVALTKALRDKAALEMDGIAIFYDGKVIAFALGSVLNCNTFDVQFEKALSGYNGAYAAVNCEFARYLRHKYPDIQYLDREEDMGLEGLRKAKKSYHPHHLIEKCWAHLKDDGFEY
ncbi:MAG: DUF2156 domain-containing protein [Clostridia bacterium]|nr:DUF2156 domain-containing protein [Clostridia bacterium]